MTKIIILGGAIFAVVVLLSVGLYVNLDKMSMSSPQVSVSPVAVGTQSPEAGVSSTLAQTTPSPEPTHSPNPTHPAASTSQSVKNPVIGGYIDGILATDMADNRKLMGITHNVFVGKVIKQVGTTSTLGSIPQTQFVARVIMNVKGNLEGSVTVNQNGGYKDGMLYVTRGGDVFGPSNGKDAGYLMQPGSTYLLATRYSDTRNVYGVGAPPYDTKLISQDSSLTDAQLKTLAENDSRVQQLQAAYPAEILSKADTYHNTTWNSYQSLTEQQKAALPYYKAPPPPPLTPTSTTSTGN